MQAGLMILLAAYTAKRDRKGAEWCRKAGIGAARQILGEPLPDDVSDLPSVDAYRAAQREASTILVTHCRACKRCKLSRL